MRAFSESFGDTVTVVLTLFAALVGIALERFLTDSKLAKTPEFQWHPWLIYVCFIALIALVLRFLIGSDSHLKDTYVEERVKAKIASSLRGIFLFIKDLCFLVLFGVILVVAADADTLDRFAIYLMVFLAVGVVWSLTELAWRHREDYAWLWLVIDLVQLLLSWFFLHLYRQGGTQVSLAVSLAVLYFICFVLDVSRIIRIQKPRQNV